MSRSISRLQTSTVILVPKSSECIICAISRNILEILDRREVQRHKERIDRVQYRE